jgi:hypothetical protein
MTLAMNFNRTSAEGQKNKPSRARANGLPDHVASFSSFSSAVRSCVVRLDVSRMGNKHKIAFYESRKELETHEIHSGLGVEVCVGGKWFSFA